MNLKIYYVTRSSASYRNGFSAKDAAIEMGISPRTVETHIAEIKSKLDCRTKPELRRKIFPK